MTQTVTNEQKIRNRAYGIWQSEGCPHGRDLDHWLAAERENMSTGSTTLTGPTKNAPAEPAAKSRDSQAAPVSREAPVAAKTSVSSRGARKSTQASSGKKPIAASLGKKSPP